MWDKILQLLTQLKALYDTIMSLIKKDKPKANKAEENK